MKSKSIIFKILETILQVMIIPCCVLGDWAEKSNGKLNFLDAAVLFDQDYLATIFIVVFALAAIIMIWTKAYKFAFIPALLELGILIKTLTDFLKPERHVLSFGYIHSGMIIAAFTVCVITAVLCHKQKPLEQ